MSAVRYLTSTGKPNLFNKLVSRCGIRQRAHTTSAAKFAVARHRTLFSNCSLDGGSFQRCRASTREMRNCQAKGRMRARRSSTVSYLHSGCNKG